ncbi:uncharacterized protein LOC110982603 [Acanthaster planci]|uniref:RING-type E3 ubiquitin transferase n=1 Tax=Acanthaster planci TaxID=133434 RepID=A0A8B7Z080_ACAPL|nr:uncharacterized protein LOC110982603 [Acanthaster planci]
METSSHTPLLTEMRSNASAPALGVALVKVQLDAGMSEHPLTQRAVNSVSELPPACPLGKRKSTGASLVKISCNAGSKELVDIRDSARDEVIPCMCCEINNDDGQNLRSPLFAAAPTESGRFQNGAAASADAATGQSTDRPRLETSRSLPSILLVPERTRRDFCQTPASHEARCSPQSSSHRPVDPPSSVLRQSQRVTGIVSDSMLSLPTGDICRICHTGGRHESLIGPCLCAGSMRYTHQRCLTTWLAQSGRSRCELCGYKFKTKLVGSRNIFQWKVFPLTVTDKLHLIIFALSVILFTGTTAYITWTATKSDVMSSVDPASLATQILLPVYCSLSFVSLGLLVYETKSTCLRLVRRWRALNMGLQIVERDPGEENTRAGDGVDDDAAHQSGPSISGLISCVEGRAWGRVRAGSENQTVHTRGDGMPSGWSVWSEAPTGC